MVRVSWCVVCGDAQLFCVGFSLLAELNQVLYATATEFSDTLIVVCTVAFGGGSAPAPSCFLNRGRCFMFAGHIITSLLPVFVAHID